VRVLDRILARALHPSAVDTVEGYCLRCKTYREIRSPARVYTKNRKPRIHDYCTVGNDKMSKLIKA
jgi:hypothetical protein